MTTIVLDAVRNAYPTVRHDERALVLDALDRLLKESGIDRYVIANVSLPRGNPPQVILRKDWPAGWDRHYQGVAWWADHDVLGGNVAFRVPAPVIMNGHDGEDQSPADPPNLIGIPCTKVARYQAVALGSSERPLNADEFLLLAAMVCRLVDRLHDVAPELLMRLGGLTARERQVVALTARGKTSNEIAVDLGISARTVFAHLTSAGDKLNASNKTETVVNAYRFGQIAL